MTLLITVLAAVAATVAWYKNAPDNSLKLSALCYMYWGASLMWFADVIFDYLELKAEYFTLSFNIQKVINDTILGISAVALGLVIWTAILLIKDPKGVVRKALTRKDI